MSTDRERERARLWYAEHRDRAKSNMDRWRALMTAELLDADAALSSARFKTAERAIRAHCMWCTRRAVREGAVRPRGLVHCIHRECELFPFRNGDPRRAIRALDRPGNRAHMEMMRKAQQGDKA